MCEQVTRYVLKEVCGDRGVGDETVLIKLFRRPLHDLLIHSILREEREWESERE